MLLEKQKNKFDDLNRKLEIVARARYKAAQRLYAHHWFTQITLMLSSTGLIVIPVLSLGGFNKNFSPKYAEVMQIIFAVMVTGYSFLLGLGNFLARSERLHQCGLRLTRLSLRIKPYLGKDAHDDKYENFQEEYCDVLDEYENHSFGDYQSVIFDQMVHDGYPKRRRKDPKAASEELRKDEGALAYVWRMGEVFVARLDRGSRVWCGRLLGYSHYVVTIVSIYAWTYMMFCKK